MQFSKSDFFRSVSAAAAFVGVLALCPMSVLAASPFVHGTAMSSGNVGTDNSLALDRSGNPYITSFEDIGDDLVLAKKAGGTWTVEYVATTGSVGTFSSLALDAQDTPHISCYDATNQDLLYATRSGSGWALEAVDVTGNAGDHTAIALNPQGVPFISYHAVTTDDLKLARRTSGFWTLETVDATGSIGYYTSLAMDAQGNAHISYYDGSLLDLKYASKAGTVWTKEIVDATGAVGGYTSIALDRQGRPRISYWDVTNGDLKYASKSGNVWTIEVVDGSAGIVGPYSSLELDADGNPRISYSDDTNNDLKYASKTGGVWTIETLDANGNVGGHTSLALDSQGNPRISYHDNSNLDLKYTDASIRLISPLGGERWAAGSEQTVRWTGAGSVSISLSQDGGLTWSTLLSSTTSNAATIIVPQSTTEKARIRVSRTSPASVAESPAGIAIAPDLSNPWWGATVDAAGAVGFYRSLALDARGNPRISYWDQTNDDLRFVSKSGSGWVSESVDAAGATGGYNSLVLDTQGNPCISYYDGTAADLRLATKAGAGWNLETVDATGDVGREGSVALDAQGNPSIAYFDDTNDRLKYASKSGGVWTLQTLGVASLFEIQLALDSRARPHISYLSDTGALMLARNLTGSWGSETVSTNASTYSALALDVQGRPHLAYSNDNLLLVYASTSAAGWTHETLSEIGYASSLTFDGAGNPHIGYSDGQYASHAYKSGGSWVFETVDSTYSPYPAPVVLDAHGNARVASYDASVADLRYSSSAIEIGAPSPGSVWPVGSSRSIQWNGTGRVELSLSVDGGTTWEAVASRLNGGALRVQVPHAPGRFAVYKLERQVPYSVAVTDLFTIESSIALLNFTSKSTPDGVALAWESDPGPSDLSGYRLEKAGAGDDWQSLVPLTRETSYIDAGGGASARYRLFGVNGLGDEILLGESSVPPTQALAAWPLPYRGGDMNVSFALFGQLGAAQGVADVALYDASGRLVRTLATGTRSAGQHVTRWDGRDDAGNAVSSGVYFLRSKSAGSETAVKVTVLK